MKPFRVILFGLGTVLLYQNCQKVSFKDLPTSEKISESSGTPSQDSYVGDTLVSTTTEAGSPNKKGNACSDIRGGLIESPFNIDHPIINPNNHLNIKSFISQCKQALPSSPSGISQAPFSQNSAIVKINDLGDFTFNNLRNSIIFSKKEDSYEAACVSGQNAKKVVGATQTALFGTSEIRPFIINELDSDFGYLENVQIGYVRNYGLTYVINSHVHQLWGNHVILINSTVDEIISGCPIVYIDSKSKIGKSEVLDKVTADGSKVTGFFENGNFQLWQ
jgi:hypothetical protein